MDEPVRRRAGVALRVVVSGALLAAVLVYADVSDVAAAVRGGDWRWFVAACAVVTVAVFVGALRWWVLLEGAGIHVSPRHAVRPYATGVVLNLVLPTAVGGDVVRAWVVGKRRGRLLGAAAATLIDRATALACLLAVAWAALAVDSGAVPESLVIVFAWVTAGAVAAAVVVVLAAASVRPIVHRLPDRLEGMLRESWRLVKAWAGSAPIVGSLAGLGVVYQVLVLISLVLIGETLGVDLPFALAAVCGTIVVIATLIPISVGGLGIREGGFVLLLGEAGIDSADATLIALLGAGVLLLAGAAVAGSSYVFARPTRDLVRTQRAPSRATE